MLEESLSDSSSSFGFIYGEKEVYGLQVALCGEKQVPQ
jgi:hypothetical protein